MAYCIDMAHTPADVLAKVLRDAEELVEVGALYVHYKNPAKPYKILSLALMEADEAPAVVYQAQYDEQLTFVRPVTSFLEEVEPGVLRFSKIVS